MAIVKHNPDDLVGKQKFTYAQLQHAWDVLTDRIKNDPLDRDSPPSNGYDIRGGYDVTDDFDLGKNAWHMEFSLEAVMATLEAIEAPITSGDLEVYFNGDKEASSDEHGISLWRGHISGIY